jgi:hypothetical protein
MYTYALQRESLAILFACSKEAGSLDADYSTIGVSFVKVRGLCYMTKDLQSIAYFDSLCLGFRGKNSQMVRRLGKDNA